MKSALTIRGGGAERSRRQEAPGGAVLALLALAIPLLLAGCGGGAGRGETSYMGEADNKLAYVEWSPAGENRVKGRMVRLYQDPTGLPFEEEHQLEGTVDDDGKVTLDVESYDTPVRGEVDGDELRLDLYMGMHEMVLKESSPQDIQRASADYKERVEAAGKNDTWTDEDRRAAEASSEETLASGDSSEDSDQVAGKVRWVQMNLEATNEQASVEEAYAARARENLRHLRENRERLRRLVPEMREASKELGGCIDPKYSSEYVSVQDFSVTNQDMIENNAQIRNTRSAAEQLRDVARAEGNTDPALQDLADKADAAAERLERAMKDRDRAAEDLNRNGERIAQEADQIKMDAGC
jgi:hypothetical protein